MHEMFREADDRDPLDSLLSKSKDENDLMKPPSLRTLKEKLLDAEYLTRNLRENHITKASLVNDEEYTRLTETVSKWESNIETHHQERLKLGVLENDLLKVSSRLEAVKSELSTIVSLRSSPIDSNMDKVKERLRTDCKQIGIQIKLKIHELMLLRSRCSK